MTAKYSIRASWSLFSATEKRNIAIYILGIMLYKFGLEAFNGSIVALATNRYDYDASRTKTVAKTFERVGLLTGLNQAFQCVGSILIAPLIKRFQTKNVLASAIAVFGLLTAVLMIVDAASGGTIRPKDWSATHSRNDFGYYGDYNTDGIIPIYCITGIAYGMVELIRRVIPRDIVGGDVQKLRRMDAMVHIFYEIAGTSGAFCTALALIPSLGNNYAFVITPVCFVSACCVWFFVRVHREPSTSNFDAIKDEPGYLKSILMGFTLFFASIWTGMNIVFSDRKFIWLLPGYSLALFGHRFLENNIAPYVARRYLGNSAWSQIMVGGSNFGELLGALFVFIFTNAIKTPIPWLRLDALLLMVVWYLPFWYPPMNQVSQAWIVAATFVPVSFGWAAGDVSLAAYIQALLQRKEGEHKDVSPLGAVMAFLYSTYIVVYAIMSPMMGRYIDRVSAANNSDIHSGIFNVGGVQFTILMGIVLFASFIPKGAFAFNPKMLNDENLESKSEENLVDEADGWKKEQHINSDEEARPDAPVR
jgi:MFS family permease